MTDTERPAEPPADLVDLRHRFIAAETALEEHGRTTPSGADIAAGVAELTHEQVRRSEELREEMRVTAEGIAAHPWITGAPNPFQAHEQVRAAVRQVERG